MLLSVLLPKFSTQEPFVAVVAELGERVSEQLIAFLEALLLGSVSVLQLFSVAAMEVFILR